VTTTGMFAFDFSRWFRPVFWLIGAGPSRSAVELGADELVVHFGLGFRARIARASISRARRERNVPWAIGVHTDFRRRWLVNGSSRGIVSMGLDPPGRARCLGVEVRVDVLALGLQDPDGFLAALGPASRTP
jgi:hypothetical protein